MPRIQIPFGTGLDRESGVMVVRPAAMEDLRNALIHHGKVLPRRGWKRTVELVDGAGNPMTDVLEGQALRSRREVIAVGYNSVNGQVHVFRLDGAAVSQIEVAQWTGFPSLSAGDPPPVIHMCEVHGRIFMAHDTPLDANRAPTIYYDGRPELGPSTPNPAYQTIVNLQGDFEGLGAADIKFRGVTTYLKYLVGWGYGSPNEQRPELVRFSNAEDPTVFDVNHWNAPGQRDDPITRCVPVGAQLTGSLLAFKEFETHEVFGYSRSRFGDREVSQLYGCQHGRLAINVSGDVFAWTTDGPYVFSDGGKPTPLHLPLELTQPEPRTLVAEGELGYAFAEFLPTEEVVLFTFGRRVYALTVRELPKTDWCYWELGFEALSGFRVPVTGGGLAAEPAAFVTAGSAANITDTTADVSVTNNSNDGDEFLEIWTKTATRPWKLVATRAMGSGAAQTHVNVGGLAGESGFYPGELNTVAMRAKRGPYFTPGYTDTNPDNWPAGAQFTFTTTLTQVPAIGSAAWSRTAAATEQVLLNVTPVHSGTDVEVLRGGVVIHTESAPTGSFSYADTGVVGEASNSYTVRHTAGGTPGAIGVVTVVWGGPSLAPTQTSLTWDGVNDTYEVLYTNGDATLAVEVRDNWTGSAWSSYPQRTAATRAAGNNGHIEAIAGPVSGTAEVGVRHVATAFGTDDYSPDDTDTVVVP